MNEFILGEFLDSPILDWMDIDSHQYYYNDAIVTHDSGELRFARVLQNATSMSLLDIRHKYCLFNHSFTKTKIQEITTWQVVFQ